MSTLDDFGNYHSELQKLSETWLELRAAEKKYVEVLEKLNMSAVVIGSKKDSICSEIKLGFSDCIDMSGKTTPIGSAINKTSKEKW